MQGLRTIFEQLGQLDFTPIVLAILLGGLVGLEREFHGRPAGLRTHILVCLCSTILVMASQFFATELAERAGSASITFDPQRLSAGIVTGIGFLGAAAVVRAADFVRGITTGACVWCVAGLGVVIGQGAYGIAVAATIAFILVLVCFNWLTGGIRHVVYRQLIVTGHGASLEGFAAEIRGLLQRDDIRVQDMIGSIDSHDEPGFQVVFHVRCRNISQAPRILDEVAKLETVRSVNWGFQE